MGIVVEYANKTGAPKWITPSKILWDYTSFGENRQVPRPDEVIPLVFGKINGGTGGFNRWTINGKSFDEKEQPRQLRRANATGWCSTTKLMMLTPFIFIGTALSLRMSTASRRQAF